MSHAEFAYAQARLHARLGRRLDAAAWRELEGSRTAARYLALARAGALASWTEGVHERAGVQRAEAQLHARWRVSIDEVARWLPERWQAATRAFGALVELPLHAEPASAPRWLAQWQRTWPADAGRVELRPPHSGRVVPRPADAGSALLLRPAEWLLPRLRGSSGGRGAGDARVAEALRRLWRRHPSSAVAVIAFLALQALDFERLRGGLVQRLLFTPPQAAKAA